MYTQREADEAQIKQQVARIAEGIRAKDLEGLRPIYVTDIVSFDVEPPLQHVGVEAKLKNWANVFAVYREPDYEVRGLGVAVGDDVAAHSTIACCQRADLTSAVRSFRSSETVAWLVGGGLRGGGR